MKHKKFLSIMITLLILALMSGVALADEESDEVHQTLVTFTFPVAIEVAVDEAQRFGLVVVTLQHSIRIAEQVFQGGYFPTSDAISAEIARQYELAYAESLSILLQDAKESLSIEDDEQMREAWQQHVTVIEMAQKHLRENGLMVASMVVQGKRSTTEKFVAESTLVDKAETFSSEGFVSEESHDVLRVNPNTWLPNRGRTIVRPGNSQDTERYVHQTMIWTNVSGFGTNSTYEHDFFLNNYDGKTYLSRSSQPNGIAIVNYWGSNLPRAYLDTRLGDPAGEVAYVVGCADGDAIQPNTWYWSQIRTAKGDINTDSAKLFGQLGYRYPSGCYSTWCVFASQTEVIVGSWSNPWAISVPTDLWWSR